MHRPLLLATLVLSTNLASGQSMPTEFPAAATEVTAEALQKALAGKVYSAQPFQGPKWRWQFNGNGYFFINVGNFRSEGKWKVEGSSVCTESRDINPGCNVVRALGPDLYLKRASGEILRMVLQ